MMRCHAEDIPEMEIIYLYHESVDIKRADRFFAHRMNHINDGFYTELSLKKELTFLPLFGSIKSPCTEFLYQG